MAFLNLPSELILNVADEILNNQDLSSLSQTCRDLHSLLNNYLYRRDAQSGNPQALFWAAYRGHVSTARKALSHGANIHARDTSTTSFPNHFPSQSLSRRWDSCPTTLHFTPLQIATCYLRESMVRYLIRHGADAHGPFPAHHDGYPLHVVSSNGPTGLVKLLLEKGAEVDVRNSKGWTPLYCAVRRLLSTLTPDKEIATRIRLLLDYGADPDAASKAGKSSRLLAKKCRDPSVVPSPVTEPKPKRPRKRSQRQKQKRRQKTQLGGGHGNIEGKDAAKGVNIGIQVSMTPVQVVKLDGITADATAQRQQAWIKMRAEIPRRELGPTMREELSQPFSCLHSHIRLFRIKRKIECGSCSNASKQSFQCPDCEVVLCSNCVE
ncbi:ankyrin repeat domain-containing protein [Histoplasma capsulatum]|uniref:Ankyrin repeat domain-containing protein n=1 Tax=Ajellomyces capsulatus TaxID=5037 RepID=A0A8A1M326_AJECA|nr:ankyrin repeat domain-containing protein [Histoplasma capsulatum]